ncbi:MAG: type 1 glutamine amidotransferase, partial [Gallionella sp.]|nr:type 1 glutamine amidotransferase [Gallionella sp.]
MKPVAIFRHVAHEGPGYLAEFLDAHKIPWQLIDSPTANLALHPASAYSGLVFMGGPMSVNDDLPWISPTLALICDAFALDVPLLGHCLGGQLISKALGGIVTANSIKEIGWGEVTVSDNGIARSWFGDIQNFQAFHWHGETFTLPLGATHLLSSPHCTNQAYAIGKHLALQCHPEMTAAMIASWCIEGIDELEASKDGLAVQSVDSI